MRAVLIAGTLMMAVAQAHAAPAPERPWEAAQAAVTAAEADAMKTGIRGIQPHAADLEAALASADGAYRALTPATGPIYKLVDSQTEALAVMVAAAADKRPEVAGRKAVAIKNPYVLASIYLGTYYDEIGKPQDALRVLDAGMALPQVDPALSGGSHRPILISERGTALVALKRMPEALADYDMGLKLPGLLSPYRGKLLRGRGYVLTELGRLDDAEQAYRDSLVADPNNQRAVAEMAYIAKIKAGGSRAPGGMVNSAPPKQ
jgi:tetratricopeptide (TPR) repeat protein